MNFAKFSVTPLIEHFQVTVSVFKMNNDPLEKCFLPWIMPLILANVFE